MKRGFAGGDTFFSFPGLDTYCRDSSILRIVWNGLQICLSYIASVSSFFSIFMCSKWCRRAGGYNCFSGPDSDQEHAQKKARGDQSYPGNPVEAELKMKMFGRCFWRSRRAFFAWRHGELRNVNRIHKINSVWIISPYHPIIRVYFQTFIHRVMLS